MQNSITVKPFIWWERAGYGVPSGDVQVLITYIDGYSIMKKFPVTGQSQPTISTNATNSMVVICDGSPVNLTATASGTVAPYVFSWQANNVNYSSITDAGNTSTMVISPQQWGGDRMVNVVVTDANGCKNSVPGVSVYDGNGWTTQSPYISGAQHISMYNGDESQYILNGSITSDLKGNVYYVGDNLTLTGSISTYQWDAVNNTWRNFGFPKNAPISTASNSLLISETVWGNRTIYFIGTNNTIGYISSINGYVNEYTVTGNWTAPANIAGATNVKRLLCVIPSDRIFYIDNANNLMCSLMTGGSPTHIDNAVNGWYGVVSGGKFYYVKNGKLMCYNISASTLVVLTDNDVLNTTYLDKYNNEVFFVSNSYYIRKINSSTNVVSNTMSPWWPATQCNGYFSINQTSGVIYFNSRPELDAAGMGSINQLYMLNGSYTNKRLTRSDQQGFVHYHYPNAFSWLPNGKISQTYFYITNCNPGIQRVSAADEAESVDQQLNYSTNNFEYVAYPNPVHDLFNIDYKVIAEIKLKIVITSTLGDEKIVLFDGIAQQGQFNISRNLNLPSGLYYCTFYVNGINTATEKIVVQ